MVRYMFNFSCELTDLELLTHDRIAQAGCFHREAEKSEKQQKHFPKQQFGLVDPETAGEESVPFLLACVYRCSFKGCMVHPLLMSVPSNFSQVRFKGNIKYSMQRNIQHVGA